uniref:Uncharacterized protein n=1 Tax=Ignisphaera aggregans TaxID=334771 RepID=A0A7J3Z528_9CREN
MASRKPRSRKDRLMELIMQGKHYAVLKEVDHIKRYYEKVKELVIDYPMEKDELILQTTVKEPGKYLIYIVCRKGSSVLHRFYLKDSSIKRVKDHTYNVITMRIPAELRGSRLYVKIFKVPA